MVPLRCEPEEREMPDRDGYPPGVPCWVDTRQPDPDAAAEFYGALFGWELEDVMPPGSEARYLTARIRGRDAAAISSGRHKGAQVVNEHGSVNFNGLNTHDVEGAKAFYGAVSGWGVLDLGPGNAMWTLPGYGDPLETLTPGLREGMRSMGAPPGFEDVVATLNALGDDEPDVPAHWSVTFAVDDADAIAERATELGGELVVAPVDAPWVRMTVIRDPEGATFIANQFVAENKDLGAP
jgi:uncharacterized protein